MTDTLPAVYIIPKARADLWRNFGVVLRGDDFEAQVLMMMYSQSLQRRQAELEKRRA